MSEKKKNPLEEALEELKATQQTLQKKITEGVSSDSVSTIFQISGSISLAVVALSAVKKSGKKTPETEEKLRKAQEEILKLDVDNAELANMALQTNNAISAALTEGESIPPPRDLDRLIGHAKMALELDEARSYLDFLIDNSNELEKAIDAAKKLSELSANARMRRQEGLTEPSAYLDKWAELETSLNRRITMINDLRCKVRRLMELQSNETVRDVLSTAWTQETLDGWHDWFPALEGKYRDGGKRAANLSRRSLAERFLAPFFQLTQLLGEALPVEAPHWALGRVEGDPNESLDVKQTLAPAVALVKKLGLKYEHITLYQISANKLSLRSTKVVRCDSVEPAEILGELDIPETEIPKVVCRVPQPILHQDGLANNVQGRVSYYENH